MAVYGKLINGFLYTRNIQQITNEDGSIQSVEDQLNELPNWKPVDDIDFSKLKSDDPYQVIVPIPYDDGNRIIYVYQTKFNEKAVKLEIEKLKTELADSDYKIIKSYEASLVNEPIQYDLKTIHAERKQLRNRINYLEKMI